MGSPKYWELDDYLKVDNSSSQFVNEQVFFSFNKYFQEYNKSFQEYPTVTALISSIFLFIGITGFLFLYVIHLRLKSNRYQKLKARKFAIWEQNLLPLIFDEADPSALIKTIKKGEYELFWEFITPYLNDIKGDSLARIVNILQEIGVAKRERPYLKCSSPTWRRALAVQRLAILKDPNNIKALTKALHDKEITVVLNAAGALLKMRDHRLMEKVVSTLLRNKLVTKELFAEVLLKFDRSIDIETLLCQKIDKYSMPCRSKILNLIEPIIKTENGYHLINRLKNSKKAISVILEDEDQAEELLSEIIYQYQNNKSIDLEKILNKEEKEFPVSSRIKIIDFIGYIKKIEGIPILIDLLKKSKNDEETISAIKALGHLKAKNSMPLLLEHLNSEHPIIRAQSAKALGAFKDEKTAKPISRLLEDTDWWCRFHAASSIYQLGETGRKYLQNFLKNTRDPDAKGIITQFLSKPI